MFKKEFLPHIEEEHILAKGDKSEIDKASTNFTRYLSKYCALCLKLLGLYEIQTLQGFLHGLTLDFEKYVHLKAPHTFDEAIPSSQMFNYIQRKKRASTINNPVHKSE